MSLRARLTMVAAVAVAIAVALASAVVYVVVRGELRGQVDDALRSRAQQLSDLPFPIGLARTDRPGQFLAHIPGPELGGAGGYIQLVSAAGSVARPEHQSGPALPAGARERAVASGSGDAFFTGARVAGVHMRILAVPFGRGWALQVARPLSELDRALSRIRLLLFTVALAGIGGAAALGLLVARTALAPVRRLTDATERVTRTHDLSERIEAGESHDELDRLAASFNTMMAELEEAERSQRQLVADASHELRTPLTSLRTNIEVLARANHYTPAERERLLGDVTEQLAEMTVLVGELMELAHGEERQEEPEEVRLDLLTAEALERARRLSPRTEFVADLEPTTIRGVPSRLERAVGNLLDNAAKWNPPGAPVEVTVREGQVCVRDHGPGIDAADLPYVFDRFYRAPAARGLPGSGLGLAIVRQVAESHGGEVAAERAEDGGTCLRLKLVKTA